MCLWSRGRGNPGFLFRGFGFPTGIDRIIESSLAMKDGVKSRNSLRFHCRTKQEKEAREAALLLKYQLDSQMPEVLAKQIPPSVPQEFKQ